MANKNYLTIEQVKREARRSLKAAIKCSLRHWQELRDATYEELANNDIWPEADYCALCNRFRNQSGDCNGCPLDDARENCFENSSVYSVALVECNDFVNNNALYNERSYRRAAQDVVTVLQDCLIKVENEYDKYKK